MQQEEVQKIVLCPKCGQTMRGHSVSYHHYGCSNCGIELNGLIVRTNQDFGQVMGAICVMGLFALFVSILKQALEGQ